jgi:hypothetical protein
VLYNTNDDSYVARGYYSTSGTSTVVATSVAVEGEYIAGIDITLLEGTLVSGTLSLESGVAPEGGIEASINLNRDISGSGDIVIEEGKSSVDWSFRVPKGSYQFIYFACSKPYVDGFYSVTGTVTDQDLATDVEIGDEDVTGIDMTLKQE